MTNSTNGIKREKESKVKGHSSTMEHVFQMISKPEILSRIAQATAAFTKLKPIWRDNKISFGSKMKLIYSFGISIFLIACEL